MDLQQGDSAVPEPIRFRPGKKRKAAYRQRTDTDSEPPVLSPQPEPTGQIDSADDDDDDESAVAAALRARNAQKARQRAAGVGFRSDGRPELDESERALVRRDEQDDAPVMAIGSRFTHQTGLLTDLNDRHMAAYIESRLSNRTSATGALSSSREHASLSPAAAPAGSAKPADQSAMQGKLMEVDIAELARPRQPPTADRAAKKPRLGRDGKPWRGRNRRGSDDIKRDKLVEEFLHENRLDVYEAPTIQTPSSTALGSTTTADDRLAEEFQRQYMDDMAARRQRKRPAQPPATSSKQAGAAAEDALKGPRLGGSRNARAAVRDALLKNQKEGKR